MRDVPKLRFSGFRDEWITKSVEDIFDKIKKPVDVDKETEYRQIGIRSHGKGIFYKESVTGEELGNKRVFWLEPDVFIVNIVFAWERAIARTTNNEIGMIASHRFPMYKPKRELLDLDFITYFFKTKKGQSLLELASPGGAGRNKTLGQKEFDNLKVKLPKVEEQEMIANFLAKVDKLIEKQDEKISYLEQYKKDMIQKIFSQEIRFKKDDGIEYPKWNQKQLGEIGYFKTSSVDKLINENEKSVKLVNYMDVYRHIELSNNTNLSIVTAKDSQIIENNLRKGDILFTPSSETPEDIGHSSVIFEDLNNTVYSYHLIRFRPKMKINILYSHYFCNVDKVRNQIVKYATGSTRFTVSLKSFEKIIVELPCLDEQSKIANFLSKIDSIVEKEKEKLEEFRKFKKGLLQKMFV